MLCADHTDYRHCLLNILGRLDYLVTEAKAILKGPGDLENGALAEVLRERLVEMQAKVEDKLAAIVGE